MQIFTRRLSRVYKTSRAEAFFAGGFGLKAFLCPRQIRDAEWDDTDDEAWMGFIVARDSLFFYGISNRIL